MNGVHIFSNDSRDNDKMIRYIKKIDKNRSEAVPAI